jgi:hypothetical protein
VPASQWEEAQHAIIKKEERIRALEKKLKLKVATFSLNCRLDSEVLRQDEELTLMTASSVPRKFADELEEKLRCDLRTVSACALASG